MTLEVRRVPAAAYRALPAGSSGPVVEVVVPVFNEEADLAPSIRRLVTHLRETFPYPFLVTIADNGSTDQTPVIACSLVADLPEVRWVLLPEKGRGNALSAVWSHSSAPVLAYLDVDLSTDLAALLPLVAPLISGHSDLAIGTRLAPGSRVVRGPKREVLSRGYNLLLRRTLGVRFTDAQCGFKAIRRDVAERLLPSVQDGGWFFDTELLVLAERAGLRIHEVPVDWVDDPDSRVDLMPTIIADLRGIVRIGRAPGRNRRPAPSGYVEALALYGLLKLGGFLVFMYLLNFAGDFRTKPEQYGGGHHLWDVLATWDGWWYRQIAEHGYAPALVPLAEASGSITLEQNSAAFFPLYPTMIEVVSALTGLGSFAAGLLVSVAASFAAAAGIYAVIAKVTTPPTGVLAAGLWAVWPGSGVEWAVYSDSLYTALAVWACYALLTGRWLTAGGLTFLAGLNRPTAVALIAALAVTGLLALRRPGRLRPVAAMLVAPAGLIGYVLWVGHRMGDHSGFFQLQRHAWDHYFDWGRHTFTATRKILVGHWSYPQATPIEDVIALAALLLSIILAFVLVQQIRPPAVLTIYTLLNLFLVIGSHQIYGNISRYLLPAFPLLIPAALALRRLNPSGRACCLTLAALASGSYAGYALFELGVP